MATATEPSDGRADRLAWLAAAGEPGARDFNRAALARVVAQAAAVATWTFTAYAVAGLVHSPVLRGRMALGLAGVAVAVVVRATGLAAARRATRRGRRAVVEPLRRDLLAAALPDHSPLPRQPGGRAAHTVLHLADQVAAYHAHSRPGRLAAGPSALLVLAVVAVVHWPVALLLALATPLLPLNLRLAGMATEDASRRQLALMRELTARLLDRFRGMRTLRTLGATEREERRVAAEADRLNRATAAVLRRAFVTAGVLDAVVTCAVAVCATYVGLTLLGYVHVGVAPHLGLSRGLLVLVLCPVYFAPLRDHAAGYHERDEALAAVPAILDLLDRPAVEHTAAPAAPTGPGTAAPAIALDGLTIGFPGHAPVLDGVQAAIPAGTVTALAAPSGTGKTTLLRCLAGLLAPTAGSVLVDGAAPRPGSVGWIGQRTVLLPGTLAANIALGDPRAGRDRIAEAAHRAGLDDVTTRLPNGLDTVVGEGGWGLSAGQARRVALARALLRDAPLWMLDEPTAHLDAETERRLLDSLLASCAGRTVVVATHSPAVLARVDRVLRLEHGRLHDDLAATAVEAT